MPTEDEIVSVPFNAGLNLKRDEFTDEPPGLAESDNVANDAEIGAANFLPPMSDLSPVGSFGAPHLALVEGGGALAMINANSQALIRANGWFGAPVTAVTSSDIVGRQVVSSEQSISEIAHGTADIYEAYAWLEVDPAGLEGAVGKWIVITHDGGLLGPFDIPVQNGPLVSFEAIALTRGSTEIFLYVYEVGTVEAIFGYKISSTGVITLANTVATGITGPVSIDVVEETTVDADRKHWLAVNFGSSISAYEITAFGSVVNNASGGKTASESGIAIDFDGTDMAILAPGLGAAAAVSMHFDPTDFFGSLVVDTEPVAFPGARATLRAGRDGFVGCIDTRKTVNTVLQTAIEHCTFFSISSSGVLAERGADTASNMRLAGDAFVDEDGGVIFPMQFTINNAEANLTRATWPVDPAIVGYLMNLSADHSFDDYSLHPIAKWGTDRARTNWGRSKTSMPYAGDPTTAEQIYGRSLLSVKLVQRQTGSLARLANGGSLFATSLAQVFDGTNFMPAGLLWRPSISTVDSPGAGSTPAGTFNYKAVFVWEDNTGLLIRSADSEGVEFVAGVNSDVRIVVNAHQPPARSDGVNRIRCWFYATQDGGDNYFLLTDDSGRPAEAPFIASINAFSLTVDNGAGNPENPILTFAVVPPEIAPQSPNGFYDVAITHGRVWGIDAEDRNTVWFSKRMSRFDPPEFNSLLTADFPEEDGELTAATVINGNPVFFKKHSVWIVQGGEGPSDVIGIGRGYARPVKVGQSGTNNRRSVVSFPGGVVFHTGRALMLLNTGLGVVPFGLEIQPSTLGPVIDSMHLSPRRELHFNFDDGQGGFRHFVYNYDVDLWSEWSDFSFIDEVVATGGRYLLRDDDNGEVVFLEEDGPTPVQFETRDVPDMTVRTAFIRPGDRNAARRVREVIVEFDRTALPSGESNLEITLFEEHGGLTQLATFSDNDVNTAYPTLAAERVILRIVPVEQFESVSVKVVIPGDTWSQFRPVSASVAFGVEPGVQRRYPEGSTK